LTKKVGGVVASALMSHAPCQKLYSLSCLLRQLQANADLAAIAARFRAFAPGAQIAPAIQRVK